MDKTALNAQPAASHNWTETCFFITSNTLTAEDQICGKVLVANEKMNSLICCLLDLSSSDISRASFCNFFYSFL